METKIPPPIVTLIFIFLIGFSNRLIEPFSFEYQTPLGVMIIICGLSVLISAARVFKQLETTINPMQPSQASKLAIIGPFKYTRNPMYLGMSIMLIGFGLIFGAKLTVCLVVMFILYITVFQIIPEERAMQEKFTDWNDYCLKVRRWL
jgi:protein-S-isoprenylcysteine O-methyltransferase Ste14